MWEWDKGLTLFWGNTQSDGEKEFGSQIRCKSVGQCHDVDTTCLHNILSEIVIEMLGLSVPMSTAIRFTHHQGE